MRRLFAVYAVVALAAVLLLGAVLAAVLHMQADRRGLAEGEGKAQLVARSSIAPLLDRAGVGGGVTDMTRAERSRLQHSVQSAVAEGQILRLRLRDLQGRVVFANAGSGAVPPGPDAESLAAAGGRTVAEVTRLNVDDEVAGDADAAGGDGPRVVEVYLPLDATGTMTAIGVLEVYLPYEPIAADIAKGQRTVTATLSLGLLLLWLCLMGVTASVVRHLRRESDAHAYLANHDALTGLPNRARFGARVRDTLAGLRPGTRVAIALLDLDRFRLVNDALGHAHADALLTTVARRLRAALTDERDVVARLGGDEFGLILHGGGLAGRLQALREVVHRPVLVDEVPITVQATVGFAYSDGQGPAPEVLLRRADIALKAAKRDHRSVLAYTPDQDAYDASALRLVSQLGPAIADGQLVLHYQPKLQVGSGCVSSVEALVRWQHPARGLLYPDAFIDAVEQTELIDDLTRWVLRQACAAVLSLRPGGPVSVAVNVSARSLVQPAFADDVIGVVRSTGTDPQHIILEITETAVMSDPDRAVQTLDRLSAAGFRISVDDFGAGQTSLSHLVAMPVHELKIDRTFVLAMLDDPRCQAIVRGVVELGHSLGMVVTAEGVESDAVLAALRAMGCDIAQGFLFSRPLPLAEAIQRLGSGRLAATALAS